jgi:hypothetical protein
MMSGIFDAAFPIIDRLIHSFPSHVGHNIDGELACSNHMDSSAYITIKSGLTKKITEKEVQEYYLLSGMVCIGAGRPRWEDAMMYLEMVITSPTQNTATGFMLEAYKKWVILGCLVTGQVWMNISTRSIKLTFCRALAHLEVRTIKHSKPLRQHRNRTKHWFKLSPRLRKLAMWALSKLK